MVFAFLTLILFNCRLTQLFTYGLKKKYYPVSYGTILTVVKVIENVKADFFRKCLTKLYCAELNRILITKRVNI